MAGRRDGGFVHARSNVNFLIQNAVRERKDGRSAVNRGQRLLINLKTTMSDEENDVGADANVQVVATDPPVIGLTTVPKEDIEVMASWAKGELFTKKKFIFNPEVELRVGGNLYRHFAKDCKDKLIGLKRIGGGQANKKMYLDLLWNEGTAKKRNVVKDGLQKRRSSVYSSMYNRFVGKGRV